jgi:NitT/TauT family transport system substrate-binding protein
MRCQHGWLVLFSALLVLTGCAPAAPLADPPTEAPQKPPAELAPPLRLAPVPSPEVSAPRPLRIGGLPTLGLAPVVIGLARGYFNQEGLLVELVSFNSETEILTALTAGQIDAAVSVTPSAGLVSAVARGLEVKIVASNGTLAPHRNIGNILVRKDLAPPSGFLDWKTLKPPIRAAATAEGSLPHAIVLLEAEKAGFKITDVSMSFLGLPQMNAALQSAQLDIAASAEPLVTLAEQQGGAVRGREMSDDFPAVPYSVMVYGRNLLNRDPEGGLRLMRAYLQGVSDYEAAFNKGLARDELLRAIATQFGADAALFTAVQYGGGLAYIDPTGAINVETLQPMLDLWVRTGLVQDGFDLQRLVDPTVARAAAKSIGAGPR